MWTPPVYGAPTFYLPVVDSTNAWAQRAARLAAVPDGALFRTDSQRAGRGQRGRSWQAAPGENFLGTWLRWNPRLRPAEVFLLTAWTALAVREAAAHWLGDKPVWIKWPNDLLVEQRKLAGMLIEHAWQGAELQCSYLGLGLNVQQLVFPAGLATAPTSLALELNPGGATAGVRVPPPVPEVAASLNAALGRWEQTARLAPARLWEQYHQHLLGQDALRSYSLGGEALSARIAGVEPSGSLLLADSRGKLQRIQDPSQLDYTWLRNP